jgi:uncharacterized protein involved in type VI secretion and phage assembly
MLDLIDSEHRDEFRSRGAKGAALAIVTDNKDTDGLGMVKLTYPWLSNKNQTDWVRVASSLAGDNAGAFLIPEKDTEVLVVFINGDINQPIVIGSLWNKEDKAPYVNRDGENNIKMLRTRTGHEIVLDDTSQKEQIRIHTHAGQEIVMDDTTGSMKIIIRDENNSNSIEIDSKSGSILISSASNITMKSPNITLEGSVGVNIKAPVITNKASSLITSKANMISNEASSISCTASGPLALKGTPVALG